MAELTQQFKEFASKAGADLVDWYGRFLMRLL